MDTENYIFFAKLSWGKSYDIQFANFHHSKFSSLAKAQELAILFHTSDLERSRTSRNLKLEYLPLQINGQVWASPHLLFLILVEAHMLPMILY